jgi:hypothetical protein
MNEYLSADRLFIRKMFIVISAAVIAVFILAWFLSSYFITGKNTLNGFTEGKASSGFYASGPVTKGTSQNNDGWEKLIRGAGQSGKPAWQPMLKYVADLHRKSTHPAKYPFDYEWEEIGPGYTDSPACHNRIF